MTQLLDRPCGRCVWRGSNLRTTTVGFTFDSSRLRKSILLMAVRRKRCDFSDLKPRLRFAVLAQTLDGIADEPKTDAASLIRGLPIERYSGDIEAACFGIISTLAFLSTKSWRFTRQGQQNVGDLSDPTTRVCETNAYLPYHTDPSDVLGCYAYSPQFRWAIASLARALCTTTFSSSTRPSGRHYRPFYYAHLG